MQTRYPGDGSSIPLEVAKKTEQIVEMLRRLPNHQFLVTVIKRNLVRSEEHTSELQSLV